MNQEDGSLAGDVKPYAEEDDTRSEHEIAEDNDECPGCHASLTAAGTYFDEEDQVERCNECDEELGY